MDEAAELGKLLAACLPYVTAKCVHDVAVCLRAVVLALPFDSSQRLGLVTLVFSVVSGGLEVERREGLARWFLRLRRQALHLTPQSSRL